MFNLSLVLSLHSPSSESWSSVSTKTMFGCLLFRSLPRNRLRCMPRPSSCALTSCQGRDLDVSTVTMPAMTEVKVSRCRISMLGSTDQRTIIIEGWTPVSVQYRRRVIFEKHLKGPNKSESEVACLVSCVSRSCDLCWLTQLQSISHVRCTSDVFDNLNRDLVTADHKV